MQTKDGSTVHMPSALVMRRISDLIGYARNARTHSDEQVAEIAASIKEFGFTNPVLLAGDDILAGHGRIRAAGDVLGLQVVPTLDLSHLNDTQRKAYILADNKIALNAGWDVEMLKLELVDLQTSGFDLAITGFHQDELNELFAVKEPAPDVDPDAVPPVPDVPHAVLGDVWLCGPHRIICGSSLDAATWETVMQGERADMIWTDPPYNVDIGGKNESLDKADKGSRSSTGGILNDHMSDSKFLDFLCDAMRAVYDVVKPGGAIYVAHADVEGYNFRTAFKAAGFKLSGCLVWRKNIMTIGRSDYQWIHEPILYGWKPGAAHKWFGGRKQVTVNELGSNSPFTKQDDGSYVLQIGDQVLRVSGAAQVEDMLGSIVHYDKPSRSSLHPTTKPTGLIVKQLTNSARRGDIVIDAFNGSGSTMIAAEMCSMVYRGAELDPRFVDVTCQRYFEQTGRVPVHALTGEPFPVSREPAGGAA